MKNVVDLSPLRVPPGCENMSSLASNGEPIVAWVNPGLAKRVLAFRLVSACLGRRPDGLRRTDYRGEPRVVLYERMVWGALSWQ